MMEKFLSKTFQKLLLTKQQTLMSEIGISFKSNNYRAFIYWRMLSSDPEKAKNTVLCTKPEIEEEILQYDDVFLQ